MCTFVIFYSIYYYATLKTAPFAHDIISVDLLEKYLIALSEIYMPWLTIMIGVLLSADDRFRAAIIATDKSIIVLVISVFFQVLVILILITYLFFADPVDNDIPLLESILITSLIGGCVTFVFPEQKISTGNDIAVIGKDTSG